jgi:hypothetical protein
LVIVAVASAMPSRIPIVTMLAPRTEARKTGNRLWTSSEDMSMNIAARPSAQMLGGNARKV